MESTAFKYRLLGANGRPEGLLASRGSIDAQRGLTLKRSVVPPQSIARARVRLGSTVVVELADTAIGMEVYGGRAQRVASSINAVASARHAESHRSHLRQRGLEREFRTALCPYCGATVDLTHQPSSPQLYCPYCDSLSASGFADPELRKYRLCARCGCFGQPRTFTELYLCFLLVFVWYRWSRHELCSSCMRAGAWRMLAFNTPFLLGIPFALAQLWRAYFGGSRTSLLFPLLEAGNAAARARKRDKAEAIYGQILERTGTAPGVRYNLAIVALRASDPDAAIPHLEEALAECANYSPAAALLRDTYHRHGHSDRAAELDELWASVEEPTDADQPLHTHSGVEPGR